MRHVGDNDNLKKGVKEIIENRRPCGLNIIHNSRGPALAYQLYDCMYTDGHSEIRRGNNLRTAHGFQDLNGTKKQKAEAGKTLHPNYGATLRACHTLLEDISNICWDFDLPESPKKRKPVRTKRLNSQR